MCSDIRLVVVGHVDHGKSTLVGRLFHDTGRLPEGKLAQLDEIARSRRVPFEWANLTDALQVERNHNVTVDAAHASLRVGDVRYSIIDAPGHRQFLRNMITGACKADAAVLVVDAKDGMRDQSRRHAVLLSHLGISQVVVLVNKMDLVDYDDVRFARVATEVRGFLQDVGIRPVAVLPASAHSGANIVTRRPELQWFEGPTLMEALEGLNPHSILAGPLRLSVQDVYRRGEGRIIVGRVESGVIRVGDTVVFFPERHLARVKTIERWPDATCDVAEVGDCIGVTLDEPIFVERGFVAAAGALPSATTTVHGKVFWFGGSTLTAGTPLSLRIGTQEVGCTIESIDRVLDSADLNPVTRFPPVVQTDELAELTIRTDGPVVLDRYAEVPNCGRFVLADGQGIAGCGIAIDPSLERRQATGTGMAPGAPVVVTSRGRVSAADRQRRHRHLGAVVWLTGLSGSGKSTLARGLERTLFDCGFETLVLDGDDVRGGLSSDLDFSHSARAENIRRVAEVARVVAQTAVVVIAALISPFEKDRANARRIAQSGDSPVSFIEVFLDAPLEACERRDPKGLYAKARSGALKLFSGVSDPYERPVNPDLILQTADLSVDECVALIVARVTAVTLPAS